MPTMSIQEALHYWALNNPDRPAVTHDGRTMTRAELDKKSNRLARAYQDLGVGADDLVAVALPNGHEFFEACFAVWKLGATPLALSSKFPMAELAAILQLARPSLLIGLSAPGILSAPVGFQPASFLSEDPLPVQVAKSWKALTSGGSTGSPKIIISDDPALVDPMGVCPLPIPSESVAFAPGPLYHQGPFVTSMIALQFGCHVITLSRFDPSVTLTSIEKYRVEFLLLVPTMMNRIWRLPEHERHSVDLSSLRIVVHSAAACAPWLKEAWINWLGAKRLYEMYGSAEAQGSTAIGGEEWLTHRGSVGRPIGGAQFKIVGPDGHILPPREIGDIYVRPPDGKRPAYHYVGAEPRALDQWESVGDMGWMDEEGYLYLADRRVDMMISGGRNIYPAEVEAALEAHPNVESAAVIGLSDEDLGHRLHAIIHLTTPTDDEELRNFCADRLISYKIPRSFERVSISLRDVAGKLRRWELRQQRSG